jgi:hypothetical protein
LFAHLFLFGRCCCGFAFGAGFAFELARVVWSADEGGDGSGVRGDFFGSAVDVSI